MARVVACEGLNAADVDGVRGCERKEAKDDELRHFEKFQGVSSEFDYA